MYALKNNMINRIVLISIISSMCLSLDGMTDMTRPRSNSENEILTNGLIKVNKSKPFPGFVFTQQCPPDRLQEACSLINNTQSQLSAEDKKHQDPIVLINAYTNQSYTNILGCEIYKKNISISDSQRLLGLMMYTLFHKKFCCIDTGSVVEINFITILQEERQRRLGSVLMEALETKAKTHGVQLMSASYQLENDAAQIFFKAHGFQEMKNNGKLVMVEKKLINKKGWSE